MQDTMYDKAMSLQAFAQQLSQQIDQPEIIKSVSMRFSNDGSVFVTITSRKSMYVSTKDLR